MRKSTLELLACCGLVGMILTGGKPALAQESEWVTFFREEAYPLHDASGLDPLLEAIGQARLVLLGESTHGTSEYYHWRDLISRRLIEEKGFRFIAVEGDWEALYALNRYVKGFPGSGNSADDILLTYNRWPQWMWANEEIVEMAEWLRIWNHTQAPEDKVGIYGIDLYGWGDSVRRLPAYFEKMEPGSGERIQNWLSGLEALDGDSGRFHEALSQGRLAEGEVLERIRQHLEENRETLKAADPQAYFNARQSVKVIREAGRHLRASRHSGPLSWNTRATHFKDTTGRLLDFYGESGKGIVWAHNTHIGDGRATSMGPSGMVNIGQLARERLGEDRVFLVGFATYKGTVLAGPAWGAPMKTMTMPPPPTDTFEAYLKQAGHKQALYLLDPLKDNMRMLRPRGHRAVGVVYRPEADPDQNYVPTMLPLRYNALIYLEKTGALSAIHK